MREVEYDYDGLGRALIEEVSSLLVSDRTERLWEGMNVVGQDSSVFGQSALVRDTVGQVAVQASDALLGLATDTRWGLTDRLGSTIGQGQGSKIGQLAEYSDWGVLMPRTLGWDSDAGYTGELGDVTAGLNHYFARSYQPMTGTWLSADPYRGTLDSPKTLGRYRYVGSNPTTFTDAYGYRLSRAGTSAYMGGSVKTCQQQYGFCPTDNGTTVAAPSPASQTGAVSQRHQDWWNPFSWNGDTWKSIGDVAQNVGAIAAGIAIWVGIAAAAVACVAATVGICAAAGAGVLLGGLAVAGAAGSTATYALSTGQKTGEGYAQSAVAGAGISVLTGGIGLAAGSVLRAGQIAATQQSVAAGIRTTAAIRTGVVTNTVGNSISKTSPHFKPPTNVAQVPPSEIPSGWRVREMPPNPDYPNGYWRLEKPMSNGGWQGIDPSTMKPGTQAETHIPFPGGR